MWNGAIYLHTFRKGEGIKNHQHRHVLSKLDFDCGNIFISGPTNVGTWYDGEKIENKIGELVLFKADMWHHVPENPTDEVRITLAIDICTHDCPTIENRFYIMEKV